MKKTMLVLGVMMFFLTSACFAAKVDPTKIVVPRDSGRIVETYVSPKADAPVIAYVQDIHANYEAQKAEADILEALIRDYGFDLVLLEATMNNQTTNVKKWKQKPLDVRQRAGEILLKNGTYLGVEYLELVSNYNFTTQGIEDINLYKAESDDQMVIFAKGADMTKLTAALQNIASNLKLHIYNKEMRDLDDKIAAYDKDEIGLVEYVKFVEPQAAAGNIDVKGFPNVALFIDSSKLEGQIDFPAVEKERATVVDAIEKALSDQAKKDEFTAKGLKFRTGDISQGEYYAYLKDAAQTAKIDLTPNKNLTAYTQYITTYEKIDTTQLFKELDNLVNKIKEALVKTPEQKQLSNIDKGLSILSDFVNTKLVPDQYNYYVQNKADFNLKGWLEFMKANSAKFNLTNPVPDDISALETNMPVLERFYTVSFDRDQAFMKNIGISLTNRGKDKAILITGGFHTVNMKKLLKEQGYSYVVIAPRVDVVKDYSALYKEQSKIGLDYANKMIATNQPSVGGGNNKGKPAGSSDPLEAQAEQQGFDQAERQGPAAPEVKPPAEDQNPGEPMICRDYVVKAGSTRFGKEEGNPQQDVMICTLISRADGSEQEVVVRVSDRRTGFSAVLAVLDTLEDTPVNRAIKAAFRGLIDSPEAGNFVTLEDNPWGLIGFTGKDDKGKAVMAFAESMKGLTLAEVHEFAERAQATGVLTAEQLLGSLGENAPIEDGSAGRPARTFRDYINQHGDTPAVRAHAAAMALTFRLNPKQHTYLTERIHEAQTIWAGKRPARQWLIDQAKIKQKKLGITLVVPKGTSQQPLKDWDCVKKGVGDATSDAKLEQATSARDTVRIIRDALAADPDRVVMAVLTPKMAEEINSLSPEEQAILARTSWIQAEDLDAKVDGVPLHDLVFGILLQMHVAGQMGITSAAHPIVQGITAELNQIRGNQDYTVTAGNVLKLLPVKADVAVAVAIAALNERARLMAEIRALPKVQPTYWDRQRLLAARSVDNAA